MSLSHAPLRALLPTDRCAMMTGETGVRQDKKR